MKYCVRGHQQLPLPPHTHLFISYSFSLISHLFFVPLLSSQSNLVCVLRYLFFDTTEKLLSSKSTDAHWMCFVKCVQLASPPLHFFDVCSVYCYISSLKANQRHFSISNTIRSHPHQRQKVCDSKYSRFFWFHQVNPPSLLFVRLKLLLVLWSGLSGHDSSWHFSVSMLLMRRRETWKDKQTNSSVTKQSAMFPAQLEASDDVSWPLSH